MTRRCRHMRQGMPGRFGTLGATGQHLCRVCGLVALAVILSGPPQAAVAQPADPDWPCVQRKVPSLSPGSMWPGLDEATLSADWRADPEVAALVGRLAPRRVPVEEAEQAIRDYAAGLEEAKREKLTLLFLGLFQTLGAERSEVMRGIERFARNQSQLAKRILADRSALSTMQQGTGSDAREASERREQLTVAIRVFEDRRASLTYVCEVPRVIEQRLFTLARTIRAELS